jgi:putative ubiquitin-RnfH superfamily antitoxin RatB of RatAB toxin-antitoxin module
MRVEVVYALPDEQTLLALEVEAGTTALDAVLQSGILDTYPELDPDDLKLGVFGKTVTADHVLVALDRVEIYRPLLADPREVRRKLASEGRTMSRGDRTGSEEPTED